MPSIANVPQPNRLLYGLTRNAVGLMLKVGQKLTVEGVENIPATGAAIIAPNHLSVHDSTVLLGVLPRLTRFIGKAEYVDDWTTRFAFLALGNIPVDRADSDSGAKALEAAAAVLNSGEMFGIFPEGTRSRDGLLHKGKTGVARLALSTGAPIVPCGLVGTDEMQQPTDPLHVIRFGKDVTVRFGEPIPVERYSSRPDQTVAPRQMTDDLMYEIAQLSGQAYVDEYMLRPDQIAEAEAEEKAAADETVVTDEDSGGAPE
ncbi:MAG: lysophospholipid acyltransferase family protein [Acidimicrobiales bacterium]|nr:lysophospholipid acyltransferase family protein [Acidimicrobiales bacterium]